MDDEKETKGKEKKRFLTVRLSTEALSKYKAYLFYVAHKSIQDDIEEYIRSRVELVDNQIIKAVIEGYVAEDK
jgi:hypothetical protein